MITLAPVFTEIVETLPQTQDEEPGRIILDGKNLPVPPSELETAHLCMTLVTNLYGGMPADCVHFEIDKPTSAHLGLLIFSTLFHAEPKRVILHSTHPRSTITRLILDYCWADDWGDVGYASRPLSFGYYPTHQSRHPWLHQRLHPKALPVLDLTNEDELIMHPRDLPARNTAIGFGNYDAAARFAELLLNASRASSNGDEYVLEGEWGFRGVGIGSAEIKIWLPGSIGYLDAEPKI